MPVSLCPLCIDVPIHHESKAITTKGTCGRFQASTHLADRTINSVETRVTATVRCYIYRTFYCSQRILICIISLISYMSRFDATHYPTENAEAEST